MKNPLLPLLALGLATAVSAAQATTCLTSSEAACQAATLAANPGQARPAADQSLQAAHARARVAQARAELAMVRAELAAVEAELAATKLEIAVLGAGRDLAPRTVADSTCGGSQDCLQETATAVVVSDEGPACSIEAAPVATSICASGATCPLKAAGVVAASDAATDCSAGESRPSQLADEAVASTCTASAAAVASGCKLKAAVAVRDETPARSPSLGTAAACALGEPCPLRLVEAVRLSDDGSACADSAASAGSTSGERTAAQCSQEATAAVAVSDDAPACEARAASACSAGSSACQTGGLFARVECPVAREKLAEIETQRRTVADELGRARERLDRALTRVAALRSVVSVAGN